VKTQRRPLSLISLVNLPWDLTDLERAGDVARLPVPINAVAPSRSPLSMAGWTLSKWRAGWLAPLLALVVLVPFPAWAGHPPLPADVPNIFEPAVGAQFQLAGEFSLKDNPDFPMLLVVNSAKGQPWAMALALDARNGEQTWSLASDPIILIILFSDPRTVQAVHVDTGFFEHNKPSGTYRTMEDPTSLRLRDLFRKIPAMVPRTSM
jgi:hypothetical protein